MDLDKIAALTAVDVYVALALVLLATGMWVGRRYVGALFKLAPLFFALLGTVGAWTMYRVGEDLNWDTPGSAGILVIIILLIAAVIIGIAGWIALGFQIRRLRKPRPPQSPERMATKNGIRVAFAIAFVVWALFSTYRYGRSHWPSHFARVEQLAYSQDGTSLYSLDESGVLKKWNAEYYFEADRWQFPSQDEITQMAVSGDGRILVTLHGGELHSWSLADPPQVTPIAQIPGALAMAPVDDTSFLLLTGDALSLRTYSDILAPRATSALGFEASSMSAYTDYKFVVGAEDAKLRFYEAGPAGLAEIDVATPPLDIHPRSIRADKSGRFLVVSDGDTNMMVLDLQTMRKGALPSHLLTDRFEISLAGKLLLAQIGITKYDLAGGSTEPLFNHGGGIGALAVSPKDDVVAIADRREIYVRGDTASYGSPELWLNGKVEVGTLISALRR